jgi:hypothetical protein
MNNDALFNVFGYGVKMSDLISLVALVVSIYVAITNRMTTRAAAQRDREREEAKTKLRIEVQDVSYDNDAPAAVRWIRIGLRCGQDEIEHILESCELVAPNSRISLEYNGTNIGTGDHRIQFPDDTIVGTERSICLITEHSLPNVSAPAHIRFKSVRRDANHSSSVVDIKVPVGRPWFQRG